MSKQERTSRPDVPTLPHDEPLTFSQAHGYEDLPKLLRLEDLPVPVRVRIWNVVFIHLHNYETERKWPDSPLMLPNLFQSPWAEILTQTWIRYYSHSLSVPMTRNTFYADIHTRIRTHPFHAVFDLLQHLMRHRACPRNFSANLADVFRECRLAYSITLLPNPTIVPTATKEEAASAVSAIDMLRRHAHDGGLKHLRLAAECLNKGDWAGAVRESIQAVEAVGRQIVPGANDLEAVLPVLEGSGRMHPAFRTALSKLYGYTSDEKGIRHSLVEQTDAKVKKAEAVFMFGACASFTSYMTAKAEDS